MQKTELFFPSTLLTAQAKFRKNKKGGLRYYHFTLGYHKLQSYDVCSWDIKHDRQNFLSFRAIFCSLPPPPAPLQTIQKIKILKKSKKLLEISFYKWVYTINENHMIYDPWDMEHDRQNHFLPFQVYQKSWSYAILFLRYGVWHM